MNHRLRYLLCIAVNLLPFNCVAQLSRNEVTVDYRMKDGGYVAEIFRGGWSQPQEIRLCEERELDMFPLDRRLYEDSLSRRACELLFAPLSPFIKKGDKIYYAVSGALHFVNIDALTDKNGRRLFERYKLFRVSDIQSRPKTYTKKEKEPKETILYGGMDYDADPDMMNYYAAWCHDLGTDQCEDCNGLPIDDAFLGHTEDGTRAGLGTLVDSKDEIKFIYKLDKYFARPKTGSRACEELFRFDVRRGWPYVLHLSTHTFTIDIERTPGETDADYKQKRYKSCGLLFSGAGYAIRGEKLPYNLNDGLLYAEEIASLDMEYCTMAVLGACNTALGVVTQDGIIGLQSAFKEAGVQTLLMTLWSVNDKATSEFMKRFYTYFYNGNNRYEAFSKARKDMIASQDFNDPLYWASFLMLD